MRFIDLNDGSVSTLSQIHRDWLESHANGPDNTAPDSRTGIFETLMGTVNDRNALEIVSLIPRKTSMLIQRLRAQLLN